MKRAYLTILILTLLSCPGSAFSHEIMLIDETETPVQQTVTLKAFSPLTFSGNEVIFRQASTRVTSIDPLLKSTLYPGGRGPNQLIIYTPAYGAHTGTNEYGTEAIVENNIVTSISGADSTIPVNGIVISGHGSAKNWIVKNITEGSKVYVDAVNKTLTVYTTSESYTFEAKSKIAEAKEMINFYAKQIPDYNSSVPDHHIQTAENYLKIAETENKNSAILKQYTQEAIDSASMAIKTALPYVKDEMRGTWLRPTEKTKAQIETTLDNLKTNGFNTIFLETYFHGKTIFPSCTMNKYGFTVQNEQFAGFDPLETWISEAHKRDMKVHIWFQSFYVGNQPPSQNPSAILAVRPDWGNKTKAGADKPGATRSAIEHNGYFIDPANPEVQAFLLELLDEIIVTYKPDGINLDYIRYPNSISKTAAGAWGFTEYAREDFKHQYGVDPAFLAALMHHESGNGTSNAIINFNNPGGIMDASSGWSTLKSFPSLDSGIEYTAKNLKNNYLDQGLTTIPKIGAKYAPVGAANDPTGLNNYWVNSVSNLYNKYSSETGYGGFGEGFAPLSETTEFRFGDKASEFGGMGNYIGTIPTNQMDFSNNESDNKVVNVMETMVEVLKTIAENTSATSSNIKDAIGTAISKISSSTSSNINVNSVTTNGNKVVKTSATYSAKEKANRSIAEKIAAGKFA